MFRFRWSLVFVKNLTMFDVNTTDSRGTFGQIVSGNTGLDFPAPNVTVPTLAVFGRHFIQQLLVVLISATRINLDLS